MDIELFLLKAKFEAFRNCFIGINNACNPDKIWLNKYLLWIFELENLQKESFDSRTGLSSPAKEVVQSMIQELNYLLDVAAVYGTLEKYGIHIEIPEDRRKAAIDLAENTDLSEEMLLQKIKKIV